jgi:winged helix DNA-binding protein
VQRDDHPYDLTRALAWRVARQRLEPRGDDLLEIAATVCGLHAQLMASAELTAWARLDGPASVSRALWEDRSLVKTWAMRGTLHLLPAAEYGVWQAALSTYDYYRKPAWFRASGVSQEELDLIIEAVGRVLEGRMLTREQLAAEVASEVDSPGIEEKLSQSWGALLKPAAFHGKLCFAPSDGQKVRFTSPSTWLDGYSRVDPDEALREVARRYLGAFGPATRDNFSRWWYGTSPAQSQKLIESLGDEVAVVGDGAYLPAAAASELESASLSRCVRLLPAFDQYVIAAPRELPGEDRDRVYRKQGWISPVLLVDGRMDGVWSHERKGSRVVVSVEPFGRVPKWVRSGVEAEAARLAEFLGGSLELSWV